MYALHSVQKTNKVDSIPPHTLYGYTFVTPPWPVCLLQAARTVPTDTANRAPPLGTTEGGGTSFGITH